MRLSPYQFLELSEERSGLSVNLFWVELPPKDDLKPRYYLWRYSLTLLNMIRKPLFFLLSMMFQSFSFSQWLPVGDGLQSTLPGQITEILDLEVFQDELYAVGRFNLAGGQASNGLAKWDGNKWESVPITGNPIKLKAFDNKLHILGPTGNLGSIVDHYVTTWDGQSWDVLDSNRIVPFFPNQGPLDIDTFRNKLIIGGYSFRLNDIGPFYNIIYWDSSGYDSFPNNSTFYASVNDIGHYGEELILTGNFNSVNSIPQKGYIRFDGQNWITPIPPPFFLGFSSDNPFQDLLLNGGYQFDGSIYNPLPYGSVHFKEGKVRENIFFSALERQVVVIDSLYNYQTFGEPVDSPGAIYCMEFFNDSLFIGGSFTKIDGKDISGIAKRGDDFPNGILDLWKSNENNGLSIFPNPSKSEINIIFPSYWNNQSKEVRIRNSNGQLVNYTIATNEIFSLDLDFLTPGLYLIECKAHDQIVTTKFVLTK